jgi:hypothetical protein
MQFQKIQLRKPMMDETNIALKFRLSEIFEFLFIEGISHFDAKNSTLIYETQQNNQNHSIIK